MMMNTHHHHHHHHHHQQQPLGSSGGGGGASDAAAALKGASLAFSKTKSKPVPPPKPDPTNTTTATRTLAPAAAISHVRSRSASPTQTNPSTPLGRDGTADMRDRLSNFLASSPSAHLTPHTMVDPKSPSYIAATLAASRSQSPSPQPSHTSRAALTPAQLNQLHQMQETARRRRRGSDSLDEEGDEEDEDEGPDVTSIPATGRLIHMFERREDVDPVKRSGGEVARPKMRPPTPEREMSPARARGSRLGVAEEEPKTKAMPVTPAERDTVVERKPAKARPITPTPIHERKPVKPSASPVKKSPHRSVESERAPSPKKQQHRIEVWPVASEPPETRSVTHSTRVPITRNTRPEAKAPPVTPESRRSRPRTNQRTPSPPRMIVRAATEVVSPKPERPASKPKLRPPTPPQPRGTTGRAKEPAVPPRAQSRSMASVYGHGPLQEPFLPRAEIEPRPSTADTSSSNDTFVSASSNQTAMPELTPAKLAPPQTLSVASTPGRSSTNSSPSRATPRRTPASSTASLPLNSLSNAIVAGSLAASRLTPSNTGSSALSPPPLPNRTKSPRLRQTLRQPPSKSDDEDEIRKKRHQRASKKHSHREGARRRWRDEISARERRRYEAVWASNRGALLTSFSPQAFQADAPPPQDAADCVANVVAREIWRRSRLPREELAEVWDVVDRGRRGMLNKQEFVVGMWLIDQRLRGRKIPAKVSASVWDSAQGIKVLSPKAKK